MTKTKKEKMNYDINMAKVIKMRNELIIKESVNESNVKEKPREFIQWNHDELKDNYTPLGELNVKSKLESGYYDLNVDMFGNFHFVKNNIRLDGLVDFGKGVSDIITKEINLFWDSEEKFRKINKSIKILYKRGILMYGPPGCGKSSMIAMIMNDVVKRDGIALRFSEPNLTTTAINVIRQIQPKTKIMIVLEDIDSYINNMGEHSILNMLDGVDTILDSVIFLATTNYKETLSKRLLRPSRFDLKIEMDYPDVELRKRYLLELFKAIDFVDNKFLDKASKDTQGFSFADLKELFISTKVFGYSYESSLEGLKMSLNTEDLYSVRQGGQIQKLPSSPFDLPKGQY